MNARADLARHAVALAAFAALTALCTAAQATVTYTYTGPNFNSFDIGDPTHPVTASGIVASFEFDTDLAIGTTDNFQVVKPVSWSISGGGYSLSSSVSGGTLSAQVDGDGIFVFADATGTIRGWDFFAYFRNGPDDNGPRFRSFYYPTGQFSTAGPAIKTDVMAYWNIPDGISSGENTSLIGGNWTVTAVPEPGTAAMWLAGVGALGFMVRRRGRA